MDDNKVTKAYTEDSTVLEIKKSNSEKFWELMKQSTITQAVVTIIIVCAYVYMMIARIPVTVEFYSVLFLVLGVFFGGKIGYNQGMNAAAVQK